jgi:hypothetical protein
MSCWTCGIQYNREDNYKRHLTTPKHINKAAEYMDEDSKTSGSEDYYTYLYVLENKDIMPPPTYRPTKFAHLRDSPCIIPLIPTIPQNDPRTEEKISFTDLLRSDEEVNMNIDDKVENIDDKIEISPTEPTMTVDEIVSKENIQNIIQELTEMGIPVTTDQIETEVNAVDIEMSEATEETPPPEEFDELILTFEDIIKEMNLDHLQHLENTLEEEVNNIDEFLNPNWTTLDSVGNTVDITSLQPPERSS